MATPCWTFGYSEYTSCQGAAERKTNGRVFHKDFNGRGAWDVLGIHYHGSECVRKWVWGGELKLENCSLGGKAVAKTPQLRQETNKHASSIRGSIRVSGMNVEVGDGAASSGQTIDTGGYESKITR